MDSDDIIRDWENDDTQIKEELLVLSDDENLNDRRADDKRDDSELVQGTFSNNGCYYFTEENKCKFDFEAEVQGESYKISSASLDPSNYSNFVSVVGEPSEHEVMVSEDPIIASKVYIDENDEVGSDQIIEKKKKPRTRSNEVYSLFRYKTEDTYTGPENELPRDSNVAEFANNSISQLHVHVKDRKLLECAICGSKFVRKRYLENHILSHSNDTAEFKCQLCNVGFARRILLTTHLKNHGLEPYKCHACGTCFSGRHSLSVHMKVHSKESLFACPICGMNFKLKSVLKTHMMVHLDNDKKFKATFDCKLCSQSFTKKSQLQKHVRAHAYEQYKFPLYTNNRV